MKKIHFALVGGQPIPVYVGIKDDLESHKVVLICSEQTQKEAEHLKAQFPNHEFSVETCSTFSLGSMETLALRLKQVYEDYDVTFNLTSGTKLWALSFFRIFSLHRHVKFIYVDQTNSITDILRNESHLGCISVPTRFELYGIPLESFTSLEEYTSKDREVVKQLNRIRWVNPEVFGNLTNVDLTQCGRKGKKEYKDSILEFDLDRKWARIALKQMKQDGCIENEYECEHLAELIFNFHWFELKTAFELRKNPNVKSIYLNGVFKSRQGRDKNEVDIIAELGSRLLFIECKTRITNPTDIDKFRSVVRNSSGTSSIALFVTNDRVKQDLAHEVEEKCRDNRILTWNFSAWRDAKEHDCVYPSLKDLVDSQINIQNPR